MIRKLLKALAVCSVFIAAPTFAQEASGILPAVKVVTSSDGSQEYSVTLQILILMTMLTFLPAIIIMMTSFIRISVVFAILRQALGLQQTPSNQILIGLTLFLSFFIMSPVISEVNDQAVQPYLNEQITSTQALEIAQGPFRSFMLAQVRENDLVMFADIAEYALDPAGYDEVPFTILVPAFITSELKTAFQIGFLIFIPFLVIDLVIASILMAMGMMMLSPMVVSLPFKIMLFVLIDGWALIVGTLANSFG
ncbi:MAG: flagellar type III secretion system pore protein FliP [Gammaproteobacteria bacterium]|nr:flagellar type III secretion system pore protein FliP [Gammaproteobacteria bacterium]